jgi:hypothetical protein
VTLNDKSHDDVMTDDRVTSDITEEQPKPPTKEEQAYLLRSQGYTVPQIAKTMGVSERTIHRYLGKAAVSKETPEDAIARELAAVPPGDEAKAAAERYRIERMKEQAGKSVYLKEEREADRVEARYRKRQAELALEELEEAREERQRERELRQQERDARLKALEARTQEKSDEARFYQQQAEDFKAQLEELKERRREEREQQRDKLIMETLREIKNQNTTGMGRYDFYSRIMPDVKDFLTTVSLYIDKKLDRLQNSLDRNPPKLPMLNPVAPIEAEQLAKMMMVREKAMQGQPLNDEERALLAEALRREAGIQTPPSETKEVTCQKCHRTQPIDIPTARAAFAQGKDLGKCIFCHEYGIDLKPLFGQGKPALTISQQSQSKAPVVSFE